jgi:hypothetical protein
MFVAKYTPAGAYVWAKNFMSTSDDIGYGVAVDSGDNVIATGYYSGSVNFGGGYLPTASSSAIFIVKLSAGGTYTWAKSFGGGSAAAGYSVAVDSSGNAVITGHFQGSADFGGGPLTSAGSFDIFLAKYSANGDYMWAKRFGNTGSDEAYGVAADSAGNVIAIGYFSGTVDFGGGPLTSAGSYDVFVAQYSADGTHQWSKRFGSTGAEIGNAVTVDSGNNAIATGYFQGTVDFGSGPLVSAGMYDIFLLKLTP